MLLLLDIKYVIATRNYDFFLCKCNAKLRKFLSAYKSHVRKTSLFTGAIPNPVRNSQTSRFVSVPGQNPERSSRGDCVVLCSVLFTYYLIIRFEIALTSVELVFISNKERNSLVTPVEFNFYELHSSSLFLISISDAYRQTRCVLNERHLRSLFFSKRALKTLSSSTRNKQTNVVH